METDLLGNPFQSSESDLAQSAFEYPKPLTEKYRPLHVAEFVGLEQPKKIALRLLAAPAPLNLLFLGESGTGKTTLARAIAEDMPAEVHHVPSGECDIKTLRALMDECRYSPRLTTDWAKPAKMHVVIIDEADSMSRASQDAFLSILDGTNRPPATLFIFTANAVDKLQDRFLSRCQQIKFSSYGIAKETADLLARVWEKETAAPDAPAPNFARIVKDAGNNVRTALMSLETQLMAA